MKTIYLMAMTTGLILGQEHTVTITQPKPTTAATPVTRGHGPMFFGKVMIDAEKGVPYSADTVTETIQVLPDGNRIKNSNKSSFARDNEGRTRTESTIQVIGAMGRARDPIVTVHISDPVAKVQYSLDTAAKLALKSSLAAAKVSKSPTKINRSTEIVLERLLSSPKQEDVALVQDVKEIAFTTQWDGWTGKDAKVEDLGSRMIEGVNAKGSKSTMTIPAGEVGNERPIEVVTETWYSEEIKAVVLSRHQDPRTGETVTRVTNIKLGSPARSLFEPPIDYKVEPVKNMSVSHGGLAVIELHDER